VQHEAFNRRVFRQAQFVVAPSGFAFAIPTPRASRNQMGFMARLSAAREVLADRCRAYPKN
jgi:hypothetical protein